MHQHCVVIDRYVIISVSFAGITNIIDGFETTRIVRAVRTQDWWAQTHPCRDPQHNQKVSPPGKLGQ